MDAHEPGLAGSQVGKPVGYPGWADDDIPGATVNGLVPDGDPDAAIQDEKGLVIGVMVQPRPLAVTSPGRPQAHLSGDLRKSPLGDALGNPCSTFQQKKPNLAMAR